MSLTIGQPISVNYDGTEPSGQYVAIPMSEWSAICFAVGYATADDNDNPMLREADRAVGGRHPIITFEAAS